MAKKTQTKRFVIKHPGSFTAWCKRRGYKGVTAKCIQEGLRSNNPRIRKKANFARNARKWNRKRKRSKK